MLVITLLGAPLPALALGLAQSMHDADSEVINYSKTPPQDPIAQLQQQIDRGQVRLTHNGKNGYLESVLKQLKIPVSSQILVFSKTSFQRDQITPRTPRAIYFNDRTYVGWVQNGQVIEVSSVDPQLGAVFYTLRQEKSEKPKFLRQTDECLQCHDSPLTRGVPGHIMRSVYPDAQGQPVLAAGTFLTTDQSSLKERWGGWYVTGTHGAQQHMGNLTVKDAAHAARLDLSRGANVTDLRRRVDLTPYLTHHSDIVALMVAEHQTHVQNLITRANYETRLALHYEQTLNKELGRPVDARLDSTLSRIRSVGERLVQALLFVKEAPLTAPIRGTSGFAEQFAAQGPRDRQNRSLRELDLKRRLFRYPCSYLLYSDAFAGLPDLAKDYLFRRLWEVLSGQDASADFAHLSSADKKAILDILLDTHREFAAWKDKWKN